MKKIKAYYLESLFVLTLLALILNLGYVYHLKQSPYKMRRNTFVSALDKRKTFDGNFKKFLVTVEAKVHVEDTFKYNDVVPELIMKTHALVFLKKAKLDEQAIASLQREMALVLNNKKIRFTDLNVRIKN